MARSAMWGEVFLMFRGSQLSSTRLPTLYGHVCMRLFYTLHSYVHREANCSLYGGSSFHAQRHSPTGDFPKGGGDRLRSQCSTFLLIPKIKGKYPVFNRLFYIERLYII